MEYQQAEETQPRIRVPSAPNVDERAGECLAEKGYREHGRQAEQGDDGVSEQPGVVGGRATGGLFEKAGVALEEENVEEEVEGEGTEVAKGREEPPVLVVF